MEQEVKQKFVGLDNYFKVATFLKTAGVKRGELARYEEINIERSARLIVEEFNELQDALNKMRLCFDIESLAAVADALIDLEYVINNMHYDLGLPAMELFNAVHENNMTKFHTCDICKGSGCDVCEGRGYLVKKSPEGKILKPDGYRPVNLLPVLYQEYRRSRVRSGAVDAITTPADQQ